MYKFIGGGRLEVLSDIDATRPGIESCYLLGVSDWQFLPPSIDFVIDHPPKAYPTIMFEHPGTNSRVYQAYLKGYSRYSGESIEIVHIDGSAAPAGTIHLLVPSRCTGKTILDELPSYVSPLN